MESPIIMFHKPKGLVVTASDERGRRTVYHALPSWVRGRGFVPAGRLDKDTRGLIFLVNDGKISDMLTRPGGLMKTYEVYVRGRVTEDHLEAALSGVITAVGTLRAVKVETAGFAGPKTKLLVWLDEGKNRHIRRMFGAMRDHLRGTPLKVTDLKRVAIGPIKLDVPSGAWRFLTGEEIAALLR